LFFKQTYRDVLSVQAQSSLRQDGLLRLGLSQALLLVVGLLREVDQLRLRLGPLALLLAARFRQRNDLLAHVLDCCLQRTGALLCKHSKRTQRRQSHRTRHEARKPITSRNTSSRRAKTRPTRCLMDCLRTGLLVGGELLVLLVESRNVDLLLANLVVPLPNLD